MTLEKTSDSHHQVSCYQCPIPINYPDMVLNYSFIRVASHECVLHCVTTRVKETEIHFCKYRRAWRVGCFPATLQKNDWKPKWSIWWI